MNSTTPQTDTVFEAILHRRAIRDYSLRPVEEESVRQLLLAATHAPSALNQQPWAFGVFHGYARLREYSRLAKEYLVATYPAGFELNSRATMYEDAGYDIFHNAGTLVVIYATGGRLHAAEDCCLAAENVMLAAHGLGLGTCPIGFAREWLNAAATKDRLGVRQHFTAVFPLVVGYPATIPTMPPRNEPDIVSWQWDQS